jgi:hypothetical protein
MKGFAVMEDLLTTETNANPGCKSGRENNFEL